jgi:hypothetical protein
LDKLDLDIKVVYKVPLEYHQVTWTHNVINVIGFKASRDLLRLIYHFEFIQACLISLTRLWPTLQQVIFPFLITDLCLTLICKFSAQPISYDQETV